MKKIVYVWIVVLIVIMVGCTIPYPYNSWDVDYSDYRVILQVNPDDAEVLLDGKFIGTAYEFASASAPLRLHSKNHELVIKKEGYKEEVINLYDYSTPDITIRLKLIGEKLSYYQSPKKKNIGIESAESNVKTPEPETVPVPKTEPEEPLAKIEAEEAESNEGINKIEPVNVTLEIEPKESAIYLNGKFWGISPEGGTIDNLRLEPGKYMLEVLKPGYQSFKKELEVKDQELKLTIKLENK